MILFVFFLNAGVSVRQRLFPPIFISCTTRNFKSNLADRRKDSSYLLACMHFLFFFRSLFFMWTLLLLWGSFRLVFSSFIYMGDYWCAQIVDVCAYTFMQTSHLAVACVFPWTTHTHRIEMDVWKIVHFILIRLCVVAGGRRSTCWYLYTRWCVLNAEARFLTNGISFISASVRACQCVSEQVCGFAECIYRWMKEQWKWDGMREKIMRAIREWEWAASEGWRGVETWHERKWKKNHSIQLIYPSIERPYPYTCICIKLNRSTFVYNSKAFDFICGYSMYTIQAHVQQISRNTSEKGPSNRTYNISSNFQRILTSHSELGTHINEATTNLKPPDKQIWFGSCRIGYWTESRLMEHSYAFVFNLQIANTYLSDKRTPYSLTFKCRIYASGWTWLCLGLWRICANACV